MLDEYKTISEPSIGEYKEKGSKFLAFAYPIVEEEEAMNYVKALKKEHFKANHHCYAYRLGLEQHHFRANDDGEPSGTAGRPILGQIDSFGLTNVLVVIVRYFGGTKLGVSGLIQAYKQSAAEVLRHATIVERKVCDHYRLVFDYALMSDVMNAIKKVELEVLQQQFLETPFLDIAIRQSEVEAKLLIFRAQVLQVSLEQAATIEKIDGLELLFLRTV